jgi:hypothetical protein
VLLVDGVLEASSPLVVHLDHRVLSFCGPALQAAHLRLGVDLQQWLTILRWGLCEIGGRSDQDASCLQYWDHDEMKDNEVQVYAQSHWEEHWIGHWMNFYHPRPPSSACHHCNVAVAIDELKVKSSNGDEDSVRG